MERFAPCLAGVVSRRDAENVAACLLLAAEFRGSLDVFFQTARSKKASRTSLAHKLQEENISVNPGRPGHRLVVREPIMTTSCPSGPGCARAIRVVFRLTAVSFVMLAAEVRQCRAQTAVTWANVGTAFATGANWVGGSAPANNTSSNIASFGTVTVQPELTADRSVARLVFSGNTAATLSGSGTLTLGGTSSLTNSSTTGSKTVAVPLKLPLFSTIRNSGELTLSGSIVGTDPTFCILTFVDEGTGAGSVISGDMGDISLTKSGSGVLTLSGSRSGSGEVTVAGGTLRLGASERLPNVAVTVSAGATFDLAGVVEEIGDLTGAGTVTVGSGTLTTGSRSSTTFSGVISGSGGLVKVNRSTTFTLTGSNVLTGLTTVSAGRLAIGDGGTTGMIVGDISVGGTVAFNRSDAIAYGGVISGTGALAKQGAGKLTLSAAQSYTGATVITGGTLAVGTSDVLPDTSRVSISSGAALDLAGFSETIGSLTGTGSVILGSGTLAVGAANVTTFNATTFAGSISGAGGLTKVGTGELQLSGTNTYAGVTTVASGTLTLRSGSALPATTPVVISAGATLYQPFNTSAATIQSLSGTGLVTLESGTLTLATSGSSTTFVGTIDGGTLEKRGAGVQTITGTMSNGVVQSLVGSLVLGETDQGALISSDILVGATLVVRGASTISSVSIANTGYFELNDTATVGSASITGIGNLYTNGSSTLGNATITVDGLLSMWDTSSAGSATITNNKNVIVANAATVGSASITNSGTIEFLETSSAAGATITNAATGVIRVLNTTGVDIGSLSGGGSLLLGARKVTIGALGSNTTFSGTITGTGGSLTKAGSGTLTLSAANTYSGTTTIAQGRLALTNAGSIGTGGLSLGTGGVFDLVALTSGTYVLPATAALVGSGTLTGVGKTLRVLGSFAPGNSPGTVTLNPGFTLDLSNSSTTVLQVTSPLYSVGSYDLVDGGGSVIFGGVLTLDFSGGSYTNGADVVRLFTNTGGLAGNFSAVRSTGLNADQYITFNATTGFVSVVPEPSTSCMALAGLACGGYLMFRRRKWA